MATMTTNQEEKYEAIVSAVETLLEKPALKRVDGDGWKAYRMVDQIRVDIDIPTKEHL